MSKIRNALIIIVIIIFFAAIILAVNFFIKPANTSIEDKARHQVVSTISYSTEKQADSTLWEYYDASGNIIGYSYLGEGNGLLGKIEIMLGLDKDMKIVGMNFLCSDAVLGLSGEKKNALVQQFIGNESLFSINVNIQPAAGEEQIAQTVVNIVNNAVQNVASLEGANNE